MGAQLSKGGVAVDGKAAGDSAAAKTNGQENGHVKTNGDVSAKPDGETVAADGNGTAEVAKETEAAAGDTIEPAPVPAEGETEAKADGEAAKEGKKKKKKFSLKNSFKFKGISLKKGKKEEAASPTTEEAKPEENGHAAEPSAEAEAAAPAADAAEAAPEAAGEEAKPEEPAPSEEAPPSEEPAAAAAAEETTPAADASEPEQKAE